MRIKCLLALLLAPLALAGPPAICWPVHIGEAKTIAENLEPRVAMREALTLLDGEAKVLVRMETLRRAALAMQNAPEVRRDLERRLMERVLDAEAAETPSPLAWFDVGYFRGAVAQIFEQGQGPGYRWVRRALALKGQNGEPAPEMELAAALLTLMGNHPDHARFGEHVARARTGTGPELLRNLAWLDKQAPAVLKYFENRR